MANADSKIKVSTNLLNVEVEGKTGVTLVLFCGSKARAEAVAATISELVNDFDTRCD